MEMVVVKQLMLQIYYQYFDITFVFQIDFSCLGFYPELA